MSCSSFGLHHALHFHPGLDHGIQAFIARWSLRLKSTTISRVPCALESSGNASSLMISWRVSLLVRLCGLAETNYGGLMLMKVGDERMVQISPTFWVSCLALGDGVSMSSC